VSEEQQKARVSALAEALREKMREVFDELLENNVHSIAHELMIAEDGTGGVGIRFGFQLGNQAVGLDGKISWSRKFEDKAEASFGFEDPVAPRLPGLDKDDGRKVTIKTGEKEITTTLGAIKRAGRRLKPSTEEQEAE